MSRADRKPASGARGPTSGAAQEPEAHNVHGTEPWWLKGLLSAGAGYVFSLLLSAVLVILALARFEPVLALERAGIDMAMRIYVAFPSLLGNVPRVVPQAYAFIDIDEAGCRAFRRAAPDDCGATTAAAPAAVAAIVDALRGSAAKVVVLDVATPLDGADRKALVKALTGASTPWFIAPIDGRPSGDLGSLKSDPATDLIAGRAAGRVWLAAMTTFSDPSASDGVVRHYPPSVRIDGPAGRRTWLPTAPFLAAALAADPRNAATILCHLYAGGGPCMSGSAPSAVILIGERRYSLAGGGDVIRLARAGALDRISYSLPPIDAGSESKTADRFRGLYDRFALSDFDLSGGVVHLPPHILDGRIVVIGTSQAAGHDWHSTPLGAMPGSEIILNAARGFIELAPAEQTDQGGSLGDRTAAGWSSLLEKVWSATWVGTVTFLPAWLAIAWIGERTRERARLMRFAGGLLCVIAFMAAFFGSFGLEVYGHSSVLRSELQEGRTVDVLTPIFGLGLEGYADASKAVVTLIESGLAGLIGQALLHWPRKRKPSGKV